MKTISLVLAALAAAAPAFAEDITPPAALVLDGVPPISTDIANKLAPYGEFRPHRMLSWNPVKREVLVARRLTGTSQVHLVESPGAEPQPLTDYPDSVSYATYEPTRGDYFVFARAEGGNETYRLYRQDVATKQVTALSPEGERASELEWRRDGKLAVYTAQPVDRNNPGHKVTTAVHVIDPAKPQSDRVVATLDGGGWFGFRFSEDGKRLAFVEYISANESYLWVMEVATGRKRRITPPSRGGKVFWGSAHFSKDGKGVFTITDQGSEFRKLAYLPLNGGNARLITPRLDFDVSELDVSFDANRIAFVTNENGSSVLRFVDLATLKELPRPPLVQGVIEGLKWRAHSSEVGFSLESARTAGDVFSYDVKANQSLRWTNGNNPEVNTSQFVEPKLVRWKSFDGREITGFLYEPPARFTGKRPVMINIHGGPEAEARPGFIGRSNYYVNELGIAVILPNVRGSEGFGKTFLKLDNGVKREDSVKDIGALLDWIREQPNLDASRVMVIGGSYGGYMVLACAFHYAERLAGAVDVVGISNFVTFLERTESYRRDLRRAEYGDERDPAMRAFLEKISPLNNTERIAKPLMVVAGKNDPRVPWTEGEQIVANLKQRGTPAWFILANDEGHGFRKKPNADFLYAAIVEFSRETLLK